MFFQDRKDAGRQLAYRLKPYAGRSDVQILALPRGGVPVAAEVARALNLPLDILVVRKLGVPEQRELAMGAIAAGGGRVLNDEIIRVLEIPPSVIERVAEIEGRELARRERAYRGLRPAPVLTNRTVILIDDGLATGATMRAAILAVRAQGPAEVIVAVPVGATETCEALSRVADQVICLRMPEPLEAIGYWYRNFAQTTDAEVSDLLEAAAARASVEPTVPAAPAERAECVPC